MLSFAIAWPYYSTTCDANLCLSVVPAASGTHSSGLNTFNGMEIWEKGWVYRGERIKEKWDKIIEAQSFGAERTENQSLQSEPRVLQREPDKTLSNLKKRRPTDCNFPPLAFVFQLPDQEVDYRKSAIPEQPTGDPSLEHLKLCHYFSLAKVENDTLEQEHFTCCHDFPYSTKEKSWASWSL